MPKTRKDYRFNDATLKRIAECQKHLGLEENETAALEVIIKFGRDQIVAQAMATADHITNFGRNDPAESEEWDG